MTLHLKTPDLNGIRKVQVTLNQLPPTVWYALMLLLNVTLSIVLRLMMLFYEGSWVHRTCVGLSKQSYAALTEDTDTPYLCPHCCMKQQSLAIEDLSTNTYIDSALP